MSSAIDGVSINSSSRYFGLMIAFSTTTFSGTSF